MNEKTPISTPEYYRRLQAQDCRSQSVCYWPEEDPCTYEYTIKARDFLAGGVYLIRYVSPGRDRLLAWYDPQANPITASELAENPGFVREVLDGWYQESWVPSPRLSWLLCIARAVTVESWSMAFIASCGSRRRVRPTRLCG